MAKETGRAEGNELPYSDLRATLQARIGGLVLLDSRILPYDDGSPLFAANGTTAEAKTAANKVVSAWCQLTLRPWSEKLGIECGDVDMLEQKALRKELFDDNPAPVVPLEGQVPDALRSDFHDYADVILAIVSQASEGAELFPGLGPVHRVVDSQFGNSISFETWPTALPGSEDWFSMVAVLSVETRPSSRLPVLVIRASKRIWCREFPAPGQLYGRRRISARVLLRASAVRAINLSVHLDKGSPDVRLGSLLFEAGRATGESFTTDLKDLVRSRGRAPNLFVGVPFRHGYRPVPRIETGVTLQDQIDLTRAIKERVSSFGFEDSRLRVLEPVTDRPKEFHQQATLHNLITHHFARVPSDDELSTRVEELFGAPENKTRGRPRPVKTIDIRPLLLANQQRLDKAFGSGVNVDLIFVCRREIEARIFRSVVSLLFADRVNVVRYTLPDGVHGAKESLDGSARLTRTQRATLRKEAWSALAAQLREEHPNSPVIVQAAREYKGKEEDSLNKDVGRNTLAAVAGCSVQYLLPPGDGRASEYMHRVQAALYDLLYAHSGLGPVPADLVSSTFPDTNRPRLIVGISVASQAASRTGRVEGAALAVAMKVDASSGRIFGRIGHLKGDTFETGVFQALPKTLIAVASAGLTSIGEKLPDRRKNFLSFIRSVIDDIAAEDPNALILIDSTALKSIWSWLSDENISSEIYLDNYAARPPASWKRLRFVRIREGSAGRLGVEKQRQWIPVTADGNSRQSETVEETYATAIERLAESLPAGNARVRHYLCAHGFGIRNRGARGQSAYRSKAGFTKVGAKTPKGAKFSSRVLSTRGVNPPWDQPSRLPVTLEITVLPSQLGDDEDAIAALVASLRNGYSHTADGTFLPSPLSFKSKILDYMDRFGTAPDVEDDDVSADEEDAEQSAEAESDEKPESEAIGYGELRRWFEGSGRPEDNDIPDFENEKLHQDEHDTVSYIGPARSTSAFVSRAVPIPQETNKEAVTTESTAMTRPQMKPPINNLLEGPDEDDARIARLIAELRSSCATLPSFVDEQFLNSVMHVVNRDVRHMHEDREWIRAVTGFPWPEERPSAQDIPRLYLEALRYPAFAIVIQHQFFPDDHGRGLPKKQISLKAVDSRRRHFSPKSLSKHESDLIVLRAMLAADNGGDKEALFAEVLGLPGQAAWIAKCAKSADGLDRLETRDDEWGELGKYLRAVVGPFHDFGNELTIGQVMEEIVIPRAMRAVQMTTTVASDPVPVNDVAEASGEVVTFAPVSDAKDDIQDGQSTSLEDVEAAWRSQCNRLEALARNASEGGPATDILPDLRRSLAALDELKSLAAALAKVHASTDALREALRGLTARAADALALLTGDQLNGPALLTRLDQLPTEALAKELERAGELQASAETSMAAADELGAKIEELEGRLPIKVARLETSGLYDDREQALRRTLELIEAALSAIKAEPAARPFADHPEAVAVPEPAPSIRTGSNDPAAAAAAVLDEEIQDIPPDEPPTEAPELAPLSGGSDPEPEKRSDPLQDEITARLDALFAAGEHGLAFHLRTSASSALPDSDDIYTATELRLASTAGRAIGLSGQDLHSLSILRSDALTVVQSLWERNDDRSIARLTLLLVGAISAALFRSDDGAAVPLVESVARLEAFEHFRKLVSAVEENRKFGFPLTPANLMAIEAHSREEIFIAEAVNSIQETISGFKSARFRFQLGERIQHALVQPQGLLGRLSSQLTRTDQQAAREVADQLQGRDEIFRFIDKIVSNLSAAQELDGPARERIVSVLSRIGQQCADLIRSIDGLAILRKSAGRLETVKRLRDLALAGVDDVVAHSKSAIFGNLTSAATRQSEFLMISIRDILQGRGTSGRDMAPLAVGLHTPLLWLPNMTWTGGWMPSPYNKERILQETLTAPIPLIGSDPASSIEAAFEARRAESAFVPAYMLLNIAHWFGMGVDRTDPLRAKLDADKEVKKNQVSLRLREAERTIERMRRMAVGSLDQSARLKETLSTIKPKNLPAELAPSFLPEELTGDRIEDFNSAFARIKEVETEAQREFEKATSDYSAQIAQLDSEGKLDPQTGAELRNLLVRHEFTTLADWLHMLQTGGIRRPLLPSGPLNWRLAQFKSMLPQLSSVDVLQVARAIDGGKSFGPLDFGHLEQDQRQQAANITRSLLPSLKRHMKSSSGLQVKETLADIVSQLLFEVIKCDADSVLTRVRQQVYVFDAKVSLPPVDSAALLLPEFGSLTQGSWRICAVTSTMSQQALLDLAEGAGPRGVLILYLGVLNSERRNQLRLELIKRKRAALVVDEALVAAALADKDDHRRAILEIAQGYSGADPYKDYGRSAVPPEMFKGRTWERSAIVDLFGSYVVFGGRRLGKTALLQQIHATPSANSIFAYVDLDTVRDASDAFEQISRRIPIFANGVRTEDDFASTVTAWLAQDDRRRLLLLIDEADNFVRNEAEGEFRCIRSLLKLMADTKNRFKFVLAGLHNVSRIVRTENSPLVQISNNPLQIGPLLNQDVDDAEFLVRGPLAAMGFEFEKREDVWRILSFTNYYPVLIQVFCEELLRLIHDRVQHAGKLPDVISTSLIEDALNSSDVKSKLFATFEKTIVSIEGRYELLTYILAARELIERDSGMAAEGMSAAEVAERAMEYWPAAFPRGSDPIELEYLLEEMEGFGIARRTVAGNFALRSRSLLELMTYSETDLARKLDGYRHKNRPPKIFDPKNNRRVLRKPVPGVDSEGHISPLTDGQEGDLLAPFSPATNDTQTGSRAPGIGVVFGTEYAGIRYVEAALSDASRSRDKLVDVELRTYESKKDMFDDAKRPPKASRPRVIVVSSTTAWRPDWVVEAERVGRVRKGEVRLVFVGDPKHASKWSGDVTLLKRVLPQIKLVKLRPLSRSYLGSRLDSLQLPGDLVDRISRATGGWSETAGPLLARITEKPGLASSLISADYESLPASPAVFDRLGIPAELIPFFRELAAYADGSTITFKDFQYLCTSDGRNISPNVMSIYSDLLGIISFSPDQSGNSGLRKVDLNPLVHAALLRRE